MNDWARWEQILWWWALVVALVGLALLALVVVGG